MMGDVVRADAIRRMRGDVGEGPFDGPSVGIALNRRTAPASRVPISG